MNDDLVTHRAKVTTDAVEGGRVGVVNIKGKALAHGRDANAVLDANKDSHG